MVRPMVPDMHVVLSLVAAIAAFILGRAVWNVLERIESHDRKIEELQQASLINSECIQKCAKYLERVARADAAYAKATNTERGQ